MRVELVNGRKLITCKILRPDEIKEGQIWAPADGSNREVRVINCFDDWVQYEWHDDGVRKSHIKDAFSFQCRYCLVQQDIK